MSQIEVRPVSGHTGADILGVNLKESLSDSQVATIRGALLKWKVVFFRDQHITPAEQAAFARRFGQPTPAHPLRDSIEGHPEVLPIDRRIFEEEYGDKTSRRDIDGWHTDVTAVINPPAGSILRAEDVPPYGGDTTWTNLVAAYEGLSAPFKRFAEKLRAVHAFRIPEGVSVSAKLRARIEGKPLVSEHPVVRFIRVAYLLLIPLTVGLMVLHNLIDFVAKLARGARGHGGGPKVVRMRLPFRIAHWLVVLSFPVLVLTGFALKYPESWWAAPALAWEGQLAFRGLVRRGRWFSPTRRAISAFVADAQQGLTGTVRLELFKGACRVKPDA